MDHKIQNKSREWNICCQDLFQKFVSPLNHFYLFIKVSLFTFWSRKTKSDKFFSNLISKCQSISFGMSAAAVDLKNDLFLILNWLILVCGRGDWLPSCMRLNWLDCVTRITLSGRKLSCIFSSSAIALIAMGHQLAILLWPL